MSNSNIKDVIIIGAGFAGMYLIHKLRKLGLNIHCIEAGSNVGGTWYWNCYPGARCDAESVEYSFSFDNEIQQEWEWSERYATQQEINNYQNYVADKLDLRRSIQFSTTVTEAIYDEEKAHWTVRTDKDNTYVTKFLIAATGCLSIPLIPKFKGLDSFRGEVYHTGRWPKDKSIEDLKNKKVAVIGTGSTGIQTIPEVAKVADELFVFHKDANYTVPARNQLLTEEYKNDVKLNYSEIRKNARNTFGGASLPPFNSRPAAEYSEEEKKKLLDEQWEMGGPQFMGVFGDLMTNTESNKIASTYLDNKIKEIVEDPEKAEILTPTNLAIGARRICVDTNYYATYNKENVTLIDVKNNPIIELTENGIKLEQGENYNFDILILATGYDAMTGALNRINILGKNSLSLKEKWEDGPTTYLGLAISGFPNFFIVTGPGSPSVLSNVITSIEQHVEWISNALSKFYEAGIDEVEVNQEYEDGWVEHVNEAASHTLLPTAASWYLGTNVPGKPRVFMPYVGGVGAYGQKITQVAEDGFEGFYLRKDFH